MPDKNFFISTAIDYVNASPHLGHALEKIQADVVARYRRFLGENVFFLSGTDENSLKNVQAAREEKIPVRELVDKNAKKFYGLKKALNLTFDDFVRTTEKRHLEGAQKLWGACKADIFKKSYKGLYCVGCEEFYKENELENGLCPEHKTKPELVAEENYFFRLSKYQDKLKDIIEGGELEIIPQTRKNEILNFINSGLEDICISRSSERAQGWGIDVPGDPSQKIWVWFDALANYLTALGYAKNGKKFQKFWQKNKNKLHVIGKGISRFHAVYWPAILLSANLSLPEKIFIHGYLTFSGQKMSKSLGNVVDPFELVKKYGRDPVRYFLLREIPPTEDGDFTYEKFEKRYNADLSKGIGNLVARVITMAKNSKSRFLISKPRRKTFSFLRGRQIPNPIFKTIIDKTWKNYQKFLDEFKFNEALISIWKLISFCDKYIEKERPWEKSKGQKEAIGNLLSAIKEIAKLSGPFLPETSEKILKQLTLRQGSGQETKKSKPLFPRI